MSLPKDLFQFHYTNPEFSGMRCFLGNGYFSTELSNNWGQGIGACNFMQSPFPIMRLAGVYSWTNRIPKQDQRKFLQCDQLFRTLNMIGVYPLDPDNASYPSIEDLELYSAKDFHQTLDVARAVAITAGKVEGLEIETEIFLSRAYPNFGAMKITVAKTDGPHFAFKHVTRKDPYDWLDTVTMKELDLGQTVWELAFHEDNYDFQKKGLYHVAQVTGIQIVDASHKDIPFTVKREEEDTDNLDFNSMSTWGTTIHCESLAIGTDQKYRVSFILYFGIYKQNDCECPRFAKVPPTLDQASRAKEGLKDVMKTGYDRLLKNHAAAWQHDIWQSCIEIPKAEERIQRMIISSFYVMGCTYLDGLAYGNGPNGINGHWWAGRTFWDHDTWVNLGIILWAPELARNFSLLRFNTMTGARENRKQDVEKYKQMGLLDRLGLNITDGLKYCWESTSSGLERCPNGGQPNIQEHISCDVIHGLWLQYIVTNDRKFLEEIAFPIAYESAVYLGQRVKKEGDGKWHFRFVCCADEHAVEKDDNAFTNLYLEKCMQIVITWCKLLKKPYPPHWEEISNNMKYHFDAKNQRIIEYEGYTNEIIKQADTDLITWPLEHDAVYGKDGETIRRNNMLFYFGRLPENHIMMSACIFSIIANELGMQEKAWEYFSDQFPHFHPELSYIPSENPRNDCWPFITGIGGFLSNLIYGYGGIRIREDGLLFAPLLNSKLPHLILPHLKFQGIDLRYEVLEGGDKFILTNQTKTKEFTIYCRDLRIYTPETAKSLKIMEVKGRTEKKYVVTLAQNTAITFCRKQ